MDTFAKYIQKMDVNFEIEVVLHGGEPILVGIDKLERIIKETISALPFSKVK